MIKHKNKTPPFHCGTNQRRHQRPASPLFSYHSLYLAFFASLYELVCILSLSVPTLPLSCSISRHVDDDSRARSSRLSFGCVIRSQAASCRGYMAHSLFSMSTARKCLWLCGKTSAIQIILSQCIPEQE